MAKTRLAAKHRHRGRKDDFGDMFVVQLDSVYVGLEGRQVWEVRSFEILWRRVAAPPENIVS